MKTLPIILTSLLLLSTNSAFAQSLIGHASFEPQEVAFGQHAYLRITIEGSRQQPKVNFNTTPDGIIIQENPVSAQANISLVNGKISVTGDYFYKVIVKKSGTYTLLPTEIEVDGQLTELPETTLTVLNRKTLSEKNPNQQIILLDLNLPREKIYLGEALPASISLMVDEYIRGKIVTPYPIQSGASFEDSPFSNEPILESMVCNGRTYKSFKWETTLTPLKTGIQPIRFSLDVIVETPRRIDTNRMFESTWASLFSGIFSESEQLPITTPYQEIQVLPLPRYGKPKDFTGAVGDFKVQVPDLSDNEANIGEPITLSVTISGEGNFKRVSPPILTETKGWKTYEPKAEFFPKDTFNYEGKKVFEYILIPEDPNIKETPSLVFNFFNPVLEKYVENNLPHLPITIYKKEAPANSFIEQPSIDQTANNTNEETPQEKTLLPIQLTPGA